MQVGFTKAEVRDAYKVFAKDAYSRVGFDEPPVKLRICNLARTHPHSGGYPYALTQFDIPECLDYSIKRPTALHIAIDTRVLPILHEDELEEVIRHECAHVVAGIREFHDYVWREKAREMGCTVADRPSVFIRNVEAWFDAIEMPSYDRRITQRAGVPKWDDIVAMRSS